MTLYSCQCCSIVVDQTMRPDECPVCSTKASEHWEYSGPRLFYEVDR